MSIAALDIRQLGIRTLGIRTLGVLEPGAGDDDPLGFFDDGFDAGALDAKWLEYEGDGTMSATVSGGELNVTVNGGGTNESFWFNAELGCLLYQEIDGDFDVVATVRIRNTADDGLPTNDAGDFRIAGIAAHDPDRATVLNYVHIGLGTTDDVDHRCEWKNTTDSTSDFESISAPTGAGQLRLTRIGQVFSAYYRATSGDAWTLVQEMDRTATPMPDALQVGFMVYANRAVHDIQLFVSSVTATTP